jgi:hypothetical protein
MRWNNLFDDLEGQLEHELTAEDVDLKMEEERLRIGRLSLRDRLLAIHELDPQGTIRVMLVAGQTIAVRPTTFGKDWFAADVVEESDRHQQCIIPLAAIGGLVLGRSQVTSSLSPSAASDSPKSLSARLSLVFVLRDLCRRRRSVQLHLLGGDVHGTIDRVGRDHLDLAVHEPGTPRRESAVLQLRVVPLAQIVLLLL